MACPVMNSGFMKTAVAFRVLLACVIAAVDAVAGPSFPAPKNPPAKVPLDPDAPGIMWGHDYVWRGTRQVKILLVRMSRGSHGVVVYERAEIVSLGTESWVDDERATGTGQDRPVTLVTESLAAALAGDGRGGGRNSEAGELGRNFLYRNP